jgi:hypothetical protein
MSEVALSAPDMVPGTPRSAVRPEGCPECVCGVAAIRNPFGILIAWQLIKLSVECCWLSQQRPVDSRFD